MYGISKFWFAFYFLFRYALWLHFFLPHTPDGLRSVYAKPWAALTTNSELEMHNFWTDPQLWKEDLQVLTTTERRANLCSSLFWFAQLKYMIEWISKGSVKNETSKTCNKKPQACTLTLTWLVYHFKTGAVRKNSLLQKEVKEINWKM